MNSLAKLFAGYCAANVILFTSSASAALLRYEPFNYVDVGTTVEGKTNPNAETWVSAYAAAAPNGILVASGNLTMPATLQPAVGNSAEINGSGNGAGKALRLPLGTTITQNGGGTAYYSLALRVDELTGSTNVVGGFFVGLNNSGVASTSNPTAAGARLQGRIDPNDPTKFNVGIFRNVNAAAAATSWSGPLNVGDTYFLVASYETVAGDQNDIARLWINPDPSTFADPGFSPLTTLPTVIDNTTGVGSDIGIASIILRQGPAPHVTLDEIRVGETWADVTPLVPEPCSLALVLIGLGVLSCRGRLASA
jgi:hypothetical protein